MSEILKTVNYFWFKRIDSNRPRDEKHVEVIKKKVQKKNLLHLFPILVNSKMEVIDGEHRLAAAEQLGVYIYYRIDDDVTEDDMANINVAAKNWQLNDFINFYTVKKQPGFDVLSQFMIDNPLIPASTVMRMLGPGNKVNSIKAGEINLEYFDQAQDIISALKEYSEIIDFAYERYFVLAVMNSLRTPGYDHQEMRRQLEYQSRSIVKCVNSVQYTEMLEDIYNYKKSKERLKFLV